MVMVVTAIVYDGGCGGWSCVGSGGWWWWWWMVSCVVVGWWWVVVLVLGDGGRWLVVVGDTR